MKTVQEVVGIIGTIPYMTPEQAEEITKLIVDNQLSSVLELGFFHGASTCFIANAVSDLEGASVVCIDKDRARALDPNVETLLEKLGLRELVDVHYEPNSYLWRLMKMLEKHQEPIFDLCYLDGAHNWFVDGFAFFLVDRLLKPGGWMVLDDLNWRYSDSPTFRGSKTLEEMPIDEAECFQIRKVFELLIQRQPGYANFKEDNKNNWAYAQKLSSNAETPELRTVTVIEERRVGLGEALLKVGRRFARR